MEIVWDTVSPNKILESREKDSRTFHYMDAVLEKKMRIIARTI